MIYKVKQGYRFGKSDQYGPGSLVDLTEDEGRGFLDKLEPVKGPAPTGIEAVEDDRPDPWRGLPGGVIKTLWDAEIAPHDLPFMYPEDLQGVKGIGPKAIEAIKGAFWDGRED